MTQNETNKLTPRQAAAVEALLTGATHEAAATAAGVARSTVARWQQQPAFVRALVVAQGAAVEAAARRLVDKLARAVDVAAELLEDVETPATVRLSAARLLLDMGTKYHELAALEGRIAALEDMVNLQNHG